MERLDAACLVGGEEESERTFSWAAMGSRALWSSFLTIPYIISSKETMLRGGVAFFFFGGIVSQ